MGALAVGGDHGAFVTPGGVRAQGCRGTPHEPLLPSCRALPAGLGVNLEATGFTAKSYRIALP